MRFRITGMILVLNVNCHGMPLGWQQVHLYPSSLLPTPPTFRLPTRRPFNCEHQPHADPPHS